METSLVHQLHHRKPFYLFKLIVVSLYALESDPSKEN